MAILSNVILFLAIFVAIVFSLLVLLTGKGDAMSGGGSVRTSYKGKATFDDIMSKATLILGVSFMALVLFYSVLSKRVLADEGKIKPSGSISKEVPVTNNAPAVSNNAPSVSNNAPAASNNAPAVTNNAPAATAANNAPSTNSPATNAPAAANNTPVSPGTVTPADNNAPKK